MYLQLLDEAVREERGEKDVHKEECLVDIKIDAYIPEDYISNQAQRVDCYRKIAKIQNDEDSTDVTDELIDRQSRLSDLSRWRGCVIWQAPAISWRSAR